MAPGEGLFFLRKSSGDRKGEDGEQDSTIVNYWGLHFACPTRNLKKEAEVAAATVC